MYISNKQSNLHTQGLITNHRMTAIAENICEKNEAKGISKNICIISAQS